MVLQRDETFIAVTFKARCSLSRLHKQFGKYSVPFSVLNDVSHHEHASSYGSTPSRRGCSAAYLRRSPSLIRLGAPGLRRMLSGCRWSPDSNLQSTTAVRCRIGISSRQWSFSNRDRLSPMVLVKVLPICHYPVTRKASRGWPSGNLSAPRPGTTSDLNCSHRTIATHTIKDLGRPRHLQ